MAIPVQWYYGSPYLFEAKREKGRRSLAALATTGGAVGSIVGGLKSERDKEREIEAQTTGLEEEYGRIEPQVDEAGEESLQPQEKDVVPATAKPATSDTDDALAQPIVSAR